MTQYARPTRKAVALIERARSQADALNRTVSDLHGLYRDDDRVTVTASKTGRVVDEVTEIAHELRIMHIEDKGLIEARQAEKARRVA